MAFEGGGAGCLDSRLGCPQSWGEAAKQHRTESRWEEKQDLQGWGPLLKMSCFSVKLQGDFSFIYKTLKLYTSDMWASICILAPEFSSVRGGPVGKWHRMPRKASFKKEVVTVSALKQGFSVAPRPAASAPPGNLLEIKCLGPMPDLLNQKLRVGPNILCLAFVVTASFYSSGSETTVHQNHWEGLLKRITE